MIFNIDTYGSRSAIIADDGTQLTYAELAGRVEQRAKKLEPGVLQFCLCKNDGTSSIGSNQREEI